MNSGPNCNLLARPARKLAQAKLRVLWLCNYPLTERDHGSTGTWLGAMTQGLLNCDGIELGIVAFAVVEQFQRRDYRQVSQWLVPAQVSLSSTGEPHWSVTQSIVAACEEFAPDLVHVWGTEAFWGVLTARQKITHPAVLEMQGLKGACARVYHGGLSFWEQCRCAGLKEIIKGRTLYQSRKRYEQWGKIEEEIIRGHHFIATQSDWMEAQVRAINPTCLTFHTDVALRAPFHGQGKWVSPSHPSIFCCAAYAAPFKGLHVAVRAVAALKQRIPEITLRIGGSLPREGIRRDGYAHWLEKMVQEMGLSQAVTWLGPLSAEQMAQEINACSAVVIPSFVENCCTSMQEAMMIGAPVVASYAGGLPSLAREAESALFFSPGDEVMCAHQLGRVIEDRALANRLSCAARELAETRNAPQRIANRQLEIYRRIIAPAKGTANAYDPRLSQAL